MLTLDDIRYDEALHKSFAPNGEEIPHVTHILGAVGVSQDFDELAEISQRTARDIETARLRGSAVHADTHAYDDNDLLITDCHPEVRPYVEAWAELRERKKLKPLARERRLFHPLLRYAGIMDGLFLWEQEGLIVLPDLKTGDPDCAACHLQTAAYEEAYCAGRYGEIVPRPERRWGIWLQPKKRVPYTITDYSLRANARQDFNKFRACLTVYHEQPARRRL